MSRKEREQCAFCKCGQAGPCTKALERIYAIQATNKKVDSDEITVGCPWFINSAEYNYCFWKFADEMDDPVSDRDMCDLLLIDQASLEETLQSAINKLEALKDTPELQEFKEALIDKIKAEDVDDTVYLPAEFEAAVAQAIQETPEGADKDAELFKDEKHRKKKKTLSGLPMHRSGKKVDLYGLYTSKAREQTNAKKDKK